MGRKKNQSGGSDKLRARAEERLTSSRAIPGEMAGTEARKLLHELQVHQVELELQNEELRTAQAELEGSRSRYADLYDFSPVGYITIDRKGLVLEANLTAAAMLGVERGSLIGTLFQRFIVSENRYTFVRRIAGETECGTKLNFELRLSNKQGEEFFILLDCILVDGLDGKRSFMVSLTDITAQKSAEASLQRVQEEKLRSILDNSPTVIYVKDLGGRYQFVNRSYEALFHVKKEGLAGKTDHDVFPRETADSFRANDLRVIKANRPLEFEEVVPHGDDPHTYISAKFPLYGASGEIEAVCGISTDITELRESNERLLRNTCLLESITRAQSRFISNIDTRILFDELLNDLLSLTGSEYGFIGEILHDQGNNPYLKTHAITDIAWDEETRAFYDQQKEVASHPRQFGHSQWHLNPLHYLKALHRKPGAFDEAKPILQWRACWPEIYERVLSKLRERQGYSRGTREFIEILQLHHDYPASQVQSALEDLDEGGYFELEI